MLQQEAPGGRTFALFGLPGAGGDGNVNMPDGNETERLWVNARIATFNPAVPGVYGMRDGWGLLVRGPDIAGLVEPGSLDVRAFRGEVIDCRGRFLTPAFIDCHTHLVFGGSRAEEWELRLGGVPYTEIARRGGGILSTVRATRAATEDELVALARPRIQALVAEGACCIEIKSGYGLSITEELKLLRAARRVAADAGVELSATLLAAHVVPPEFAGRADDYVSLICDELIPLVARDSQAEAVDVFCESIAFTVAQCDRIFTAAKKHHLAVKGHVEQITNSHGAELIARHGGWSADHLEYLDDAGVASMARSGTVAVLLPGAYYFLREKQKPPVESLRAAGVSMAVATDFNPGTSPFASLRLAMNMACVLYGLTAAEALAGVTRSAARALGRSARLGTIEAGKQADFLLWDIAHPAEIVLQLGVDRLFDVVKRGRSCRNPT